MELQEANRLRTPKKSERKVFNCTKAYPNALEHQEEQSTIYMGEIYTKNKTIDKLNLEIQDKAKHEEELSKRIEEIDRNLNEKIKQYLIEINEQKGTIEDLMKKISVLEKSHEFHLLIEYYEDKFSQIHQRNINNIHEFTQTINKITSEGIIYNRDEVWRSLVKKYEGRILELEESRNEYEMKERKIFARQKFFEKYCYQAEEKIEKISKISKKFFDKEQQSAKLKLELDKYKTDFTQEITARNKLEEEIASLKSENEKLKKFMNKIQPIIRLDWEGIKETNEDNYQFLMNQSKEQEKAYSSKNIITLLDGIKDFIRTLSMNISQKNKSEEDISPILQVVEDIKHYTMMLFKKIQILSINQYNVINTACELNEKIHSFKKHNKVTYDFIGLLKDVRNACSKLLYDYNPK